MKLLFVLTSSSTPTPPWPKPFCIHLNSPHPSLSLFSLLHATLLEPASPAGQWSKSRFSFTLLSRFSLRKRAGLFSSFQGHISPPFIYQWEIYLRYYSPHLFSVLVVFLSLFVLFLTFNWIGLFFILLPPFSYSYCLYYSSQLFSLVS